ncbi:MAG: hypothetical protein D6813_15750, partial [Calditrichaeota bacterium]
EAASRTLENPTPQRIRNLVNTLVEKKIQEGQLDDSDLTLKEINRIEEAFIVILMGIHHLRIEYPKEEGQSAEAKKATRPGKEAAVAREAVKNPGEPSPKKEDQPVALNGPQKKPPVEPK